MKYLFFICLLLTLAGCNETPKTPEKPEVKKGKYFFDFDEVVYYKTNLTLDEYSVIINKENKSKYDAWIIDLMSYRPMAISDSVMFDSSEMTGFVRKKIPIDKYPSFRENLSESYTETTSINLFKDIYVFKRKHKIIGIAKLCYDCRKAVFTGTTAQTYQFGNNNEYQKLSKIVK